MKTSTATSLTIEHALLGFVYDHPSYGYEIYQQLTAPTGLWQVWRMKQSQLYALLAKLEEVAYLTATLQLQDARPPRKIYSLTASGRAAFAQWLLCPVTHGRQMRLEFLAKLYFTYRQAPTVTLHLLDQQVATCMLWLADLQQQAASGPTAQSFDYAVQQFRISQIEAFLAWLETCRQPLLTGALYAESHSK